MLDLRLSYSTAVTKKTEQLIKKLAKAKERKAQGLFVAEGVKLVRDMLLSFNVRTLIILESVVEELLPELNELSRKQELELIILPDSYNFARLSSQNTPQGALAIFELPYYNIEEVYEHNDLMLYLDKIQDPGNLGTIIRTADWFGIKHIVCSEGTVDAFSPKVVQSSMAALTRVQIHRLEGAVSSFFGRLEGLVLGTFLEGDNLYQLSSELDNMSIRLLVMGNEGNGISQEVATYVTRKITIPTYGEEVGSESLNVAIATAICLSELRR